MVGSAGHDLGAAESVEAEAVGVPGERTFRIRLLAADASASLWLEKEQVQALATAIQQILVQHRQPGETRRPQAPSLQDFPRYPTHDFRVGRLALGFDEGADNLVIYATDMDAEDPGHPTLRVTFTRQQARLFSAQAEATVAAGRSLCPLCKAPLDEPTHLCPPANGHSEDAVVWLGPPDL